MQRSECPLTQNTRLQRGEAASGTSFRASITVRVRQTTHAGCMKSCKTRNSRFSTMATTMKSLTKTVESNGVLPDSAGNLRDLGTWQQQVAEFPFANPVVPWHGYPIWAVSELAPPNRSGQKMRPAKTVFAKMQEVGLITRRQRKRLFKGDHT